MCILAAIYCGNLAFGPSSLDVMFTLQKEKVALRQRIDTLKRENARMIKSYFELKGLLPKD